MHSKHIKGTKGATRLSQYRASTVPDYMCLKMRYADFRQYTCSANVAERVFRLNSIYDPDSTLGTGEVAGYAAWSALYQNYRVVACKYKVSLTGSGSGAQAMLTVVPTESTAGVTTTAAATIEAAVVRNAKVVQSGAGGPVVSLSDCLHMTKVFGVSEAAIMGDNNYQAAFGSNPAFQYYLHVCLVDQANAVGVLDVLVELTYYVRLEKAQTTSLETFFIRSLAQGQIKPALHPRVATEQGCADESRREVGCGIHGMVAAQSDSIAPRLRESAVRGLVPGAQQCTDTVCACAVCARLHQ